MGQNHRSVVLRVAIVEDEPSSRELLRRLLEIEGYAVFTAAGGKDGLELIDLEQPHVALIDVGLPDLDGLEMARRVRRDRLCSDVVLIALTGHSDARAFEATKRAGFDAHLVKPAKYEDLSRILTAVSCGNSSSTRAADTGHQGGSPAPS